MPGDLQRVFTFTSSRGFQGNGAFKNVSYIRGGPLPLKSSDNAICFRSFLGVGFGGNAAGPGPDPYSELPTLSSGSNKKSFMMLSFVV